MASEIDLATIDGVRAWLGFNDKTVEFNDDLERLISACSTTMQRIIGRTIAQVDYKHSQDGNGSAFMVLRNSPIVRVSACVVDGRTIPLEFISNNETTVYLTGGHRFTRGRNNVALRYSAGFDPVPFDLEQACIETVGLRWRERDRIGHTSKSVGGETVSFTLADFSPSVRAVMRTYERVAPV